MRAHPTTFRLGMSHLASGALLGLPFLATIERGNWNLCLGESPRLSVILSAEAIENLADLLQQAHAHLMRSGKLVHRRAWEMTSTDGVSMLLEVETLPHRVRVKIGPSSFDVDISDAHLAVYYFRIMALHLRSI